MDPYLDNYNSSLGLNRGRNTFSRPNPVRPVTWNNTVNDVGYIPTDSYISPVTKNLTQATSPINNTPSLGMRGANANSQLGFSSTGYTPDVSGTTVTPSMNMYPEMTPYEQSQIDLGNKSLGAQENAAWMQGGLGLAGIGLDTWQWLQDYDIKRESLDDTLLTNAENRKLLGAKTDELTKRNEAMARTRASLAGA